MFADSLERGTRWLKNDVSKMDINFAKWLYKQMTQNDGTTVTRFKVFHPGFLPDAFVSLTSLLTLCGREWLDDDVIDWVLHFFSLCYGEEGKVLFLPPFWERHHRWAAQKDKIAGGRVRKLFTVVFFSNHWTVICFDFESHRIQYGDSLNWSVPVEKIDEVLEWLESFQPRVEDKKGAYRVDLNAMRNARGFIEPLPIVNQTDSASCGVLALNAIEKAVNPYYDWDQHTSPLDMRVRFARMLTGYTEVRMNHDLVKIALATNRY